MGWIDRWDIVLMLVAGYVAVMTLVRLMARRRDQNVAEVEKQMAAIREQQEEKKRRTAKNRDAA
jgi:type II secretory pathway pseudopilin PulG